MSGGFELFGKSSTTLRARAGWFAGSLDINLEITNRGSTSLSVTPNRFHVMDRNKVLVPLRVPSCDKHKGEEVVTLAPGESCWMFAEFEVMSDRQRLQTLILTHDGVTRDGIAVPVSVSFEQE